MGNLAKNLNLGKRVLPPIPETSDREISAGLPGKERQGKKGTWIRKEGKSRKGRCKIENGRRKSHQMRRGPFIFVFVLFCFVLFCFVLFCFCFILFCFVLFCFVLFCFVFSFSLFKTTEFFFSLPKWEFSTRKKHFTPGKKSGKMTLPPLKNISLTPLPLTLTACTTPTPG